MKKMLDDMEIYFGPNTEFDPVYYEKLTTCMSSLGDDLLLPSQKDAWKGMLEYSQSNGSPNDFMDVPDRWGSCVPSNPDSRCGTTSYIEQDKNVLGNVFNEEGMIIFQPCNYASNIAYYHSASRICDYPKWSVSEDYQIALKRAFSGLAFGSAFWHGSHTYVGGRFDNELIALIFYIAY
jgi:hypothetical protein